jgi:hypothetical protein
MYMSIVAGMICIRSYKFINRHDIAAALASQGRLASKGGIELVSPTGTDGAGAMVAAEAGGGAVVDVSAPPAPPQLRHKWLKYLHAIFMIYSYTMLVGAGQAFTGVSPAGATWTGAWDRDTVLACALALDTLSACPVK